VRPIGSSSPQKRFAVAWLTMVTGAVIELSASVKSRPRSNGMPIA
jgi:hypothetical protein